MFQSWQNLRIISANSAESIIHAVLDSVLIKVLISNGNSGIDALIRINLSQSVDFNELTSPGE